MSNNKHLEVPDNIKKFGFTKYKQKAIINQFCISSLFNKEIKD